MHAEFTRVFDLALSEKLQLVEDLWDSIATDTEKVPLLKGQKKNLQDEKQHS
jgi:putative addiction module component (TIGR02574 family)